MKKRISKIVGCKSWKLVICLLLISVISVVSVGCGDDDDNGSPTGPTGVIPIPSTWAGQDISFTVSGDSSSISNFSVTYSGRATGTYCSYDYERTESSSTSRSINNGVFSVTLYTATANGIFTDPNNATIEVSWSEYDSQCGADVSGSRTYTASVQ